MSSESTEEWGPPEYELLELEFDGVLVLEKLGLIYCDVDTWYYVEGKTAADVQHVIDALLAMHKESGWIEEGPPPPDADLVSPAEPVDPPVVSDDEIRSWVREAES